MYESDAIVGNPKHGRESQRNAGDGKNLASEKFLLHEMFAS